MTKIRIQIPKEIATEIMFISDSTCCVCRERGKHVQIHHIDEDPSNNEIENLSILCLECHNDTQISGGFGRKLNSDLVIRNRNDWIYRVKNRREKADEIAIGKMAQIQRTSVENKRTEIESISSSDEKELKIRAYIDALPKVRKELQRVFRSEWDSGVTSRMIEAHYLYVESLQTILVQLASFYPKESFDNDNLIEFFAEQISQCYKWHHSIVEPYGPGTGGTIVGILISHAVVKDVEKMIADMAAALLGLGISVKESQSWKQAWTGNASFNYLNENRIWILKIFKANDKQAIKENIAYLWDAWINRDGAISSELSEFFSELLINNPDFVIKMFENYDYEFRSWLDDLQHMMFTAISEEEISLLTDLKNNILKSLEYYSPDSSKSVLIKQQIIKTIETLTIRKID